MSRHLYFTTHNGELTTVLMGWDKTHQGFYMMIDKPDSEKERPIFSHLSSKENYPKSLKPYLEVLNQFRLTLPLSMVQEVAEDGAQDIGNKDITHHVIGGEYVRKMGIDESLL